jgi:hypothetical protein
MFKFQAVVARIQPFLSRSVEKRGDQSRFKSLGLSVNISRSRYDYGANTMARTVSTDPNQVRETK